MGSKHETINKFHAVRYSSVSGTLSSTGYLFLFMKEQIRENDHPMFHICPILTFYSTSIRIASAAANYLIT